MKANTVYLGDKEPNVEINMVTRETLSEDQMRIIVDIGALCVSMFDYFEVKRLPADVKPTEDKPLWHGWTPDSHTMPTSAKTGCCSKSEIKKGKAGTKPACGCQLNTEPVTRDRRFEPLSQSEIEIEKQAWHRAYQNWQERKNVKEFNKTLIDAVEDLLKQEDKPANKVPSSAYTEQPVLPLRGEKSAKPKDKDASLKELIRKGGKFPRHMYLFADEVCKFLGFSARTLRRRAAAGLVTAIDTGYAKFPVYRIAQITKLIKRSK